MNKLQLFTIDNNSSTPKYKQLVESLISAISNEELKRGDKLPSINQICEKNRLSRDTVMMAFNELKTKGVILSRPGKGYFVQNTKIEISQRVFVLFDELNSFKEDMYNAILENLDENTDVDIYFHHFNVQVFTDLITNAIGNYTSYIIMPATFQNTHTIIDQLPADKVYILDRKKEELKHYPTVYQDFENDVYEALMQNHHLLNKYEELIILDPGGKEPYERVNGFKRYVNFAKTKYRIIPNLKNEDIKKSSCYLVILDRSLVQLIKMAEEKNFKLGEDIGIISFNDTVLKEVVSGGISTISTDFYGMGKTLAHMINTKENQAIRNPWMFVKRASV